MYRAVYVPLLTLGQQGGPASKVLVCQSDSLTSVPRSMFLFSFSKDGTLFF